MASQQESKTIPLKMLVDKQRNKVVFVEATKDFLDTLFSFLSLPLATIVRLLATTDNNDQQQQSESSPFLGNIKHLYQSVQNITTNHVWNNPVCKEMLLSPRNPCESLCKKLFLNIDDTEPSNKFFVCDSCYKFTTFQNLHCTCGKPTNRQPKYLDIEDQGNKYLDSDDQGNKDLDIEDQGNKVFVRESAPLFLVSDDLKIVPRSLLSSMQMLIDSGYARFNQLEEVTHNIGKNEILNLLKYALTSHEPLTNAILATSSKSKNKDNPPNHFTSAVRVMPCTTNRSKMDIKVLQSKSQKKIMIAEADGDFVDFIFSFLTMPLGSIVKLLGPNFFGGCVGNLYKSVENLDSSWCTDSRTVLLNPGVAHQFGCRNQPLDIPELQPPHTRYWLGTRTPKNQLFGNYTTELPIEYVISKSRFNENMKLKFYNGKSLSALDPRSLNGSKEGVIGFVKRASLYGIGDDLKVKPLSANYFHSYLKELSLPIDDLEVKMISIGEAEALSFLGAFLTSRFTLTSGLKDLLNVPTQESTVLKVPKQESTMTSK